jgi:hypothetical protein
MKKPDVVHVESKDLDDFLQQIEALEAEGYERVGSAATMTLLSGTNIDDPLNYFRSMPGASENQTHHQMMRRKQKITR